MRQGTFFVLKKVDVEIFKLPGLVAGRVVSNPYDQISRKLLSLASGFGRRKGDRLPSRPNYPEAFLINFRFWLPEG